MRLPSVVPTPKRVHQGRGLLQLRDGLPIVLAADTTDADFATARALRERLREDVGLELPVETHARPDDLGPHIALRREGGSGEAYRIEVDERGAELVGAGPAGLRWAVETLAQLADARGRVPCCEIEDAPDLPLRGIMLDVSRGKVPTLETLCGVVDNCARLKLNVLMLYVEHTFRFRRHPQAPGRGALGVAVHQQHPALEGRQCRGQIDRGRGFSHSALATDNCEDLRHLGGETSQRKEGAQG